MESVKHIILTERQAAGALIISRTLLYSACGQIATGELCKLNKSSLVLRKNEKKNSRRKDKKTIKGEKKTSEGEQEKEFVLPPPSLKAMHGKDGRAGRGRGGLLDLTCYNLLGK